MPISLQELTNELVPSKTILIFGAGASIPSGAPSVTELIAAIGHRFGIDPSTLSLSELSGLAERKRNRRDLINLLREKFHGLHPKGALLNLPLYDWKSLFTTNYDELVEDTFSRAHRPLTVISSNFDFGTQSNPGACSLFKLHGTIKTDISDGHTSRLILTNFDYDATQDYREALYFRLASDLSPGTQVVIIGQSLADNDLRDVVQMAVNINQKSMSGGKITLLLYERDNNRAELQEMRGIKVAFGSLDDFFSALGKKAPDHLPETGDGADPLNLVPNLRPVTRDVSEEVQPSSANASAIFDGWPANYSDIARGFTFDRTLAVDLPNYFLEEGSICAVILGGSGVGKTSAARQSVLRLRAMGFHAWEHKSDHPLSPSGWLEIANHLRKSEQQGVLFIDEAQNHLYEINELIDLLSANETNSFKLILVSTRNHWRPRMKTPNIFTHGQEFFLSQLDLTEIEGLLTLVETTPELRTLVETGFAGFSRFEKRRRLISRCEADMFVCMRNIFASEKFDDIILREFGTLNSEHQDIYRIVAAMENAGVHVHRQLVMRILGIDANTLTNVISTLEDIITEYDVDTRQGVYGWKIRHSVIAGIIAKYKYSDIDKRISLFEKVIESISPTYDIEIRTMRDLCNGDSGLGSIPDKQVQNRLLRRMISIAPGERVPRHRLIRNLLALGEYEKAESEIRIFEQDCGKDGPVARYRILLIIARAIHSPGLMDEDRVVILEHGKGYAENAVQRYENNKYVISAYCDLGLEYYRLTGSITIFDTAIDCLKKAESILGDPDVLRMIERFNRRLSGQGIRRDDFEIQNGE